VINLLHNGKVRECFLTYTFIRDTPSTPIRVPSVNLIVPDRICSATYRSIEQISIWSTGWLFGGWAGHDLAVRAHCVAYHFYLFIGQMRLQQQRVMEVTDPHNPPPVSMRLSITCIRHERCTIPRKSDTQRGAAFRIQDVDLLCSSTYWFGLTCPNKTKPQPEAVTSGSN